MPVLKSHEIVNMDAWSIAKSIQSGQTTSYNVTTTYINHLKKVNKKIHAMVEERFEQAIAEAKQLDELAEQNQWMGPLHGVPFSMKEAIDVKGMKTTGGLLNRKDFIAKKDATVVARLKQAGAIIVCKTNTPALCYCQETDNKLYGRTNNPWDLSRTAGGSSGGEGSMLGAGAIAAGIGSDIGGSIRFPSHFNGVVGFKAGRFQISEEGHYPSMPHILQKRMFGIGPMGKSVKDMRMIYTIIADKPSKQTAILDQFTIDFLPVNECYILSIQSQRMYYKVKEKLALPSIREALPPFFSESAQLWQEMMSIDGGASIQQEAFPPNKLATIKEYITEKLTRKSSHHHFLSWALIGAKLFEPSPHRKKEIDNNIKYGDEIIQNHFKNRLFVLPVYPTGARKHGEVYNQIFSIRKTYKQYMPYVAYANVWGLPSLTIPIGTDENKMPIGIQLISDIGNEEALFQLGEVIENKFGSYQPSPMLI